MTRSKDGFTITTVGDDEGMEKTRAEDEVEKIGVGEKLLSIADYTAETFYVD